MESKLPEDRLQRSQSFHKLSRFDSTEKEKEKVSNLCDLIFLVKKNFVFDLVRKEPENREYVTPF